MQPLQLQLIQSSSKQPTMLSILLPAAPLVISPEFFPQIDRIFPWKALNPYFGAQDEGFLEFRSR